MADHQHLKAFADVAATLGAALTVIDEVAKLLTPLLTLAVAVLTLLWWLFRLRELMAERRARIAREKRAAEQGIAP